MVRLIYTLSLGFCLSQLWAQTKPVEDTPIPYTIRDRDRSRDMLMTMKLGFENMEKQIQANRVALEKQIQANRIALEKQIQANRIALEKQIQANRVALEKQIETSKTALDKRLDFHETLLITVIGILASFIVGAAGYIIYVQNQERRLARSKIKLKASDGTISIQDFQDLIERTAKLEEKLTTLKR